MDHLLLVEDADSLRDVLTTVLEGVGYKVTAVASAEAAIKVIDKGHYSLVLSDFKLPQMNGIELLQTIRSTHPNLPFLIMTAFGSIEVAVEAMKQGANDFITKPFEPGYICQIIDDVINNKRITDRRLGRGTRRERSIISKDPRVMEILDQARKVARFDSSVLILGESGTGKELLARYIHEYSARKDREFVSVNCAALPAELLESEFFGHEAGSFTGATQSREGLFEYATDGTIFLDEIGEMPALLQVKLLRALQEREIKRVGGNKSIKVNPRIIAATNRNIEDSIASGILREDLYYRLAVVSLCLPPLKERNGDIKLLAEHFIKFFAEREGREPPKLEEVAEDILQTYKWPGNARELENVIERAVIMSDKVISPEHLGINLSLDLQSIEDAAVTLPEIVNRATRKAEVDMILKVLEQTQGNKSRAAERLGVSYKTLLNKIKEYHIGNSNPLS